MIGYMRFTFAYQCTVFEQIYLEIQSIMRNWPWNMVQSERNYFRDFNGSHSTNSLMNPTVRDSSFSGYSSSFQKLDKKYS